MSRDLVRVGGVTKSRCLVSSWLVSAALLLLLAPAAQAAGRDVGRARKLLAAQDYEGAIALLEEAVNDKQRDEVRDTLASLLDDALWGRAETAGTEASYGAYVAARPAGLHRMDALVRGCGLAWTAAHAASAGEDPAPLVAFAETHRACPQLTQATEEASRMSFARALRAGTSAAMEGYLAAWPDSAEVPLARTAVDDLSFAEAAAAPGLEQLTAYVVAHPTGAHLAAAAQELEARSWEGAQAAESVGALEAFIVMFPTSVHLGEAHQLVRQRARGLFRLENGEWAPAGVDPWKRGTLLYKPPPGGPAPAALQIWGLHAVGAGEAASPVASLLGHWAAGPLGIDARILELPTIRAGAAGPDGEFRFEVPLDLPRWEWAGAQLVAYEARVIDASGALLATQRLPAGPGNLNVEAFFSGTAVEKLTGPFPDDPSYLAALAAVRIQAGDHTGAAKVWSAARERWPDLPKNPAGLLPSSHTGAVYLAYGDREDAPGADGNGFLPFYSATSGRFTLSPPTVGDGTLFLDDGKVLGTAEISGASARPEWYTGKRRGVAGTATLTKRPLPANFLDHPLFVITPAERRPVPGPAGLESFLARFPSLRAAVGDKPAAWLAQVLERAGVSDAAGPFELGNNGLPTYLGTAASKLVVVRVDFTGRTRLSTTPYYTSGSKSFRFLTDVEGDGSPEAVFYVPGACSGMQAIVVRERNDRIFADQVSGDDDCD